MNLGLTRWEPFRSTPSLARSFGRDFGFPGVFEDMLPSFFGERADSLLSTPWIPAADITEGPDKLVLAVELPGVDPEQVKVHVEGNTLTIEGERKAEEERSERAYTRIERAHGQFVRSFTLPSTVDTPKITATLDQGLLSIEMPKTADSHPRQIPIGREEVKAKKPVREGKSIAA